MKIVLFLRRIGPYHHARFKRAALENQLYVVETRPNSKEYPWIFSPDSGYEWNKLGVPPDQEKGFVGMNLMKRVAKVLREAKPDVIVTVGWADQEYHAVFLHARKQKIPLVLISDSTSNDVKRYILLEQMKKTIVKQFNSAIVAGKRSKGYLIDLGFKKNSIFQPWDVIDNDHFKKLRTGVEKPGLDSPGEIFGKSYFLCVARFIPKKNLLGLVHAYVAYLSVVKHPRKLLIVGAGPMEKELINQVGEYLNRFIFIKEFMQYEELPLIYQGAYFFILPSYSDQWGLVVNEAMASGIPVIVSEQCGCSSDLVLEKKTGFIFNANSTKDLTKIFSKVDNLSPSVYQVMQHRCRKLVVGRFGLTDFSTALKEACNYASSHTRRDSFLNKLISNYLIYR